jgi:hypothetical protein
LRQSGRRAPFFTEDRRELATGKILLVTIRHLQDCIDVILFLWRHSQGDNVVHVEEEIRPQLDEFQCLGLVFSTRGAEARRVDPRPSLSMLRAECASVDVHWALEEIDQFLTFTRFRVPSGSIASIGSSRRYNQGTLDDIRASAQIVEQIMDRVIPDWRPRCPTPTTRRSTSGVQHIDAATRTKAQLVRQEELDEKLGESAPRLSAGYLHPWVWESARIMWGSGHYREAVSAAARAVNAYTQAKVGRRDLSEFKLLRNAFSADQPKPGERRLRLMADDGSDTFQSIHRGIGAYAEGLSAAIRNPNNHELLDEPPPDEALEQLAAFWSLHVGSTRQHRPP